MKGSWQEGGTFHHTHPKESVSCQKLLLPWQGFWQDGFQV